MTENNRESTMGKISSYIDDVKMREGYFDSLLHLQSFLSSHSESLSHYKILSVKSNKNMQGLIDVLLKNLSDFMWEGEDIPIEYNQFTNKFFLGKKEDKV